MKHRARKRFGQNFLKDPAIIQQIIQAIAPKKDDTLIEIGPGMGALTLPLAQYVDNIRAIEIDWDLQSLLRSLPDLIGKLELITEDALKVDFRQWGSHLRIVGNLPYNISTPLLMHLLNFTSVIDDMHFMLQKEVVLRLSASPGNKAYGRLTVMAQYYCQVVPVLEVPPTSFTPAPKVDSAVVRLLPYAVKPWPFQNVDVLRHLVTTAFNMRRKTLRNNLKTLLSDDDFATLQVDASLRPEQISVEQYVTMANFLCDKKD